MKYKIKHGYSFNKESNSLTYMITYLNEENRDSITITCIVYKGAGNTWKNSVQIAPDEYDKFIAMINNMLDQQKNAGYKLLSDVNAVSGNTLPIYLLYVNNLLKALMIEVSNPGINQTKSVIDFLTAWQGNSDTTIYLQDMLSNGWLPKEAMASEEYRLNSIIWLSIDSMLSRLREYTDTVEGVFMFSSMGTQVVRVEIVGSTNNPYDLCITIQVSQALANRISQNVFGDYIDWIRQNIGIPVTFSGASVDEVMLHVRDLLIRFHEILIASNVQVKDNAISGMIGIARSIFDSSAIHRNAAIRKDNAKVAMDKNIVAINVGLGGDKENAIAIEKSIYDQVVADADNYQKRMSFYRQKAISDGIRDTVSLFVLPISYERIEARFIPAEEKKVERSPEVETMVTSDVVGKTETVEDKPIPVTVVSSAPVTTVAEKKGSFWSEVLTGVTVGTITAIIMKGGSKKEG